MARWHENDARTPPLETPLELTTPQSLGCLTILPQNEQIQDRQSWQDVFQDAFRGTGTRHGSAPGGRTHPSRPRRTLGVMARWHDQSALRAILAVSRQLLTRGRHVLTSSAAPHPLTRSVRATARARTSHPWSFPSPSAHLSARPPWAPPSHLVHLTSLPALGASPRSPYTPCHSQARQQRRQPRATPRRHSPASPHSQPHRQARPHSATR